MSVFEILPLVRERREELLHFFDGAFADNPKWGGCYCHCYYADHAVIDWPSRTADQNRAATSELIDGGGMQGWLAVSDGRAIGWCNAAPKSRLKALNDEPDPHCDKATTGAIVCFLVNPDWRGRGVARALLEVACAGLVAQGLTVAEAYPRTGTTDPAANHFGPLQMYLAAGFHIDREDDDGSVIVRRALNTELAE